MPSVQAPSTPSTTHPSHGRAKSSWRTNAEYTAYSQAIGRKTSTARHIAVTAVGPASTPPDDAALEKRTRSAGRALVALRRRRTLALGGRLWRLTRVVALERGPIALDCPVELLEPVGRVLQLL